MKKACDSYKRIFSIILLGIFFTSVMSCNDVKKENKVATEKEVTIPVKEIHKYTKKELIGAWMRNQGGNKDVLELRENGTFALAGNQYWVGRNWKFENDSLQLELMGSTLSNDDFSYVSYAVVPEKDPKIFNLRTNSKKNMANNDYPFVKLATNYPTDYWVGRWDGVEGTMLEILPNGDFYDITIYGLDGFIRVMSEKTTNIPEIVFYTDDGKKHIIKAGSGEETGMKWLMDETNCLIIPSMKTGFCK